MRKAIAPLLAILLSVGAWRAAALEIPSDEEKATSSSSISFDSELINADVDDPASIRDVAQPLEGLRAWISSVGAGAGMFDADGNGLSDDVCVVDPRTDDVTIHALDTERYSKTTLNPAAGRAALPYDKTMAPMGCTLFDANRDGIQDVMVYYWGRSPIIFLGKGLAGGGLTYHPQELIEPYEMWNTNAVTIGDFDTDGGIDIVTTNYFPDDAPILDPSSNSSRIQMNESLSDADNGGTKHFFRFVGVGHENSGGERTGTAGTAGTPEAVPREVRYEEVENVFTGRGNTRWTLAIGTQDLNGDALPDLYIANDFGPDQLLLNTSRKGHPSFREIQGVRHLTATKSNVVGRDSFKGMGVAFADVNADEVPDILVSNITEPYALHESNFAFLSDVDAETDWQVAPYDDASESLGISRTGWSWDVKAVDFDNNGQREIMHATGFVRGQTDRWAQLQEAAMSNDLVLSDPRRWPRVDVGDDLSGRDTNSFFVETASGRFADVADEVGVESPWITRGFAVGDVDGDGRQDFVAANQWGPSIFFRNTSDAGEFVGFRPMVPGGDCQAPDPGKPTPAIGAEIRLTDGGDLTEVAQIYPANGHGGASAPEAVIGLGKATPEQLRAKISWRDACGRTHTAETTVRPGWHDLLLRPDGSIGRTQ